MKEIVVSGIRPTGHLHLGNYFGAVQNFGLMQDEYDCFFFIADWHSLTTHPRPENIQGNAHTILAEYLACGIDPDKAVIYIQSDVPEITELYLYLNMLAQLGELERVASFKDKVRLHPDNVNVGLLTYPTLMAADVLIHKATKVPVGKDQEQNMEMIRRYARHFNHLYNVDLFPEPESFHPEGPMRKVPGLNGSGKMGKSEGNAIYLSDDEKTIRKKVMKAVTDAGPTIPNSPKPEPIANLFALMELVSDPSTLDYFDNLYKCCEIRYGDMKKQLTDDINRFCTPIRERIHHILADIPYLKGVAKRGAEHARQSAIGTLNEVRQTIGFPCR
ncbi:MAG: tryptophan--tRNA ligase [Tannerellaceae bacterium]|jgi:tryptophanyl-tRNA synthetase|nr:tryptophan--tRNA ligase [Tannerellaceae bacterium]